MKGILKSFIFLYFAVEICIYLKINHFKRKYVKPFILSKFE